MKILSVFCSSNFKCGVRISAENVNLPIRIRVLNSSLDKVDDASTCTRDFAEIYDGKFITNGTGDECTWLIFYAVIENISLIRQKSPLWWRGNGQRLRKAHDRPQVVASSSHVWPLGWQALHTAESQSAKTHRRITIKKAIVKVTVHFAWLIFNLYKTDFKLLRRAKCNWASGEI